MSILANITVYQCDDCHAIATVQTDEDCASFDADWATTITLDFCPGCKDVPANRDRVAHAKRVAHELKTRKENELNGH